MMSVDGSNVQPVDVVENQTPSYASRTAIFVITIIFHNRWLVIFGWIIIALLCIFPASLVESYTLHGFPKPPEKTIAYSADQIKHKLFPYQSETREPVLGFVKPQMGHYDTWKEEPFEGNNEDQFSDAGWYEHG